MKSQKQKQKRVYLEFFLFGVLERKKLGTNDIETHRHFDDGRIVRGNFIGDRMPEDAIDIGTGKESNQNKGINNFTNNKSEHLGTYQDG
jgi:hypothetical protein